MPRVRPFTCRQCGAQYTGARCPACYPPKKKRSRRTRSSRGSRRGRSAAQVLRLAELPAVNLVALPTQGGGMPRRAARPCAAPGCPKLAGAGQRFCQAHLRASRRAQDARRGTSTARGYGAQWRTIRARHLVEQPCCERCGAPATLVHHRVPLRAGGTHAWSNLMAVCVDCHAQIHAAAGDLFGRGRGVGIATPTSQKNRMGSPTHTPAKSRG